MTLVFFSPYSAIWKHSEIELSFLRKVSSSYANSIFLSCRGLYSSFCNSMSAFGLSENSSTEAKMSICNICKKNSNFKEKINFNLKYIEDYIKNSENHLVNNFMNTVSRDNWANVTFQNIPIGRAALYEIQLRYKLIDLNLSEEIWHIYLTQLKYCVQTIIAARNFLLDNNASGVVVYNDLYSLNYAFTSVAKDLNLATYSLQANGPVSDIYSRYSIDDHNFKMRQLFENPEWNIAKNKPLNFIKIYKVSQFLNGLLSARSFLVYSSRTTQIFRRSNFRSKWNIPRDKKIILVTLSSQDEIMAELFQNQSLHKNDLINSVDLTKKIIEFCKINTEWFFIVRPHPREFSNKREKTNSQSGKELLDFLRSQTLPKNMFISFPEYHISLYQLIFVSDFILNLISSAGIESLAFGRPVLYLENNLFSAYPRGLNIKIDRELLQLNGLHDFKVNKTQKLQQEAFRWLWFRYFLSTENTFANVSRYNFKLMNIARAAYVRKGIFIPIAKILFHRKFAGKHMRAIGDKFVHKFNFGYLSTLYEKEVLATKFKKARVSHTKEALFIRICVNILRRKIFFILD